MTDDVLSSTDVLIWWGHAAHGAVEDAIAAKVRARVLDGMGLIVLHSAHYSKPFTGLMGTSCSLKWREAGEKERLWVIEHGHPIVEGLGEYFELEHAEMYGEPFDVPEPDTLIFVSWFPGGEVFRSGCCYYRGRGKIFYFRPGHEHIPSITMKTFSALLRMPLSGQHPAMPRPLSLGMRTLRTLRVKRMT